MERPRCSRPWQHQAGGRVKKHLQFLRHGLIPVFHENIEGKLRDLEKRKEARKKGIGQKQKGFLTCRKFLKKCVAKKPFNLM